MLYIIYIIYYIKLWCFKQWEQIGSKVEHLYHTLFSLFVCICHFLFIICYCLLSGFVFCCRLFVVVPRLTCRGSLSLLDGIKSDLSEAGSVCTEI